MIFGQKNYKFSFTEKQQKYKNILVNNIRTGKYKLVETKCLCGNIATKEVPDIDVIDNFFPFDTAEESGGMKVVMCGHCGLCRTNPYYNDESSLDYYVNLYRNIYINNNLSNEEYFEYLYNTRYSSASAYFGYDFITPFIDQYKKNNYVEKVKIFEVGCGYGTVLARFFEDGEDVYGCDYGEQGIATAKSKGMKNVVVGGVDQLQQFGKADIIIVNHVLEHVINPNDFIKELKTIIHENTLVFIGVPEIVNSITVGLMNAYHMFQDAHIWHFNNMSLNDLMFENGFKHIKSNSFIQAIYVLDKLETSNKVENKPLYNNSNIKITLRYLEQLNIMYFKDVDNRDRLLQKDSRINYLEQLNTTYIKDADNQAQLLQEDSKINQQKTTFKGIRKELNRWIKFIYNRLLSK